MWTWKSIKKLSCILQVHPYSTSVYVSMYLFTFFLLLLTHKETSEVESWRLGIRKRCTAQNKDGGPIRVSHDSAVQQGTFPVLNSQWKVGGMMALVEFSGIYSHPCRWRHPHRVPNDISRLDLLAKSAVNGEKIMMAVWAIYFTASWQKSNVVCVLGPGAVFWLGNIIAS